jgi:GNAT superfamily N-acetyltransferase
MNEEEKSIRIIEYSPEYQPVFQSMNKEWIQKYFVLEAPDFLALDQPKEYILDKGGMIYIALYQEEPVGVCALIRMNDPEYDYELAKMTVSPKFQGKKIGYALGKFVLEEAKRKGAQKIYLESNRILIPAIHLYHKLGFTEVHNRKSPYARADILMERRLD